MPGPDPCWSGRRLRAESLRRQPHRRPPPRSCNRAQYRSGGTRPLKRRRRNSPPARAGSRLFRSRLWESQRRCSGPVRKTHWWPCRAYVHYRDFALGGAWNRSYRRRRWLPARRWLSTSIEREHGNWREFLISPVWALGLRLARVGTMRTFRAKRRFTRAGVASAPHQAEARPQRARCRIT